MFSLISKWAFLVLGRFDQTPINVHVISARHLGLSQKYYICYEVWAEHMFVPKSHKSEYNKFTDEISYLVCPGGWSKNTGHTDLLAC